MEDKGDCSFGGRASCCVVVQERTEGRGLWEINRPTMLLNLYRARVLTRSSGNSGGVECVMEQIYIPQDEQVEEQATPT